MFGQVIPESAIAGVGAAVVQQATQSFFKAPAYLNQRSRHEERHVTAGAGFAGQLGVFMSCSRVISKTQR